MALREERAPPKQAQVCTYGQHQLDPPLHFQKRAQVMMMSWGDSKGHEPQNMLRQEAANEKAQGISTKLTTLILKLLCGYSLWTRGKSSVSSTENLRRQHKIRPNLWLIFPRLWYHHRNLTVLRHQLAMQTDLCWLVRRSRQIAKFLQVEAVSNLHSWIPHQLPHYNPVGLMHPTRINFCSNQQRPAANAPTREEHTPTTNIR